MITPEFDFNHWDRWEAYARETLEFFWPLRRHRGEREVCRTAIAQIRISKKMKEAA